MRARIAEVDEDPVAEVLGNVAVIAREHILTRRLIGLDDTAESRDKFFQIFDSVYQRGAVATTVHGRTVMQRYDGPGSQEAIRSYVALAAEHGIDPATLALKFCDSRPFVTSTIIGATSMAQLSTDIDAFDLEWTDELGKAVDALHVERPNPCP